MIRRVNGFSLIELMVVVSIVGLLASVAVPSYTAYIVRANRVDAKDKLSEAMFEMERFATRNRTYTIDLTDLGYTANPAISNEGLYQISAAACGAGITVCVDLTATPVSGKYQALAGEAVLTLDSRGAKTGEW